MNKSRAAEHEQQNIWPVFQIQIIQTQISLSGLEVNTLHNNK